MGALGQSIANKVIEGIDWENDNGFGTIVYRVINSVGRIFLYGVAIAFIISLNSLRRLPES